MHPAALGHCCASQRRDVLVAILISQAGRDDKTQDDKAAMRRVRVRHLRTLSTKLMGGGARGENMQNAFEQTTRRAMHFYWRFARGLTLGARAVVIDEARRIFLVKHTYVRGWHLPGGGVEPGETLLAALARELCEEGNIELAEPPLLHGVFYNPRWSRRDHVACFVVQSFRQSAPVVPNREIAAAGFFALDELPGDTGAGSRARIAEVLLGAPVSERW
jgi:8-oxo-dGTP pyrophosphatase MutT (NUDIX family)